MIDLHLHSTFSDGLHTPEALVDLTVKRGLCLIALTDHDTLDGVPRFLAAAAAAPGGPRAIAGVEISLDSASETLHLLGYGVDPAEPELSASLARIRTGRTERNAIILTRLQQQGIPIRIEDVRQYADGPVVGRPHFARALMDLGVVGDVREAFDRFLARGRCAYVERSRMGPETAIARIHRAGGLAVLAHPLSMGLHGTALRRRVRHLAELGLDGIEVYYAEYARETIRALAVLAADFRLFATGGTDYHGDAHVRPGVGPRQGCDPQRVMASLCALLPLKGLET